MIFIAKHVIHLRGVLYTKKDVSPRSSQSENRSGQKKFLNLRTQDLFKSEMDLQMDGLVQAIGEIAQECGRLARHAKKQYTLEVEDILRSRCRDPWRIEHLLDCILDFGFDAAMFCSIKNSAATTSK